MVTHTGWLVCSQILPMFLHMWFIFWLDWPRENIAAGWAFPGEDDVLVSSCLEISPDSMHRNSNNNNKIIEVISREILYSGKRIKSEITSAAAVPVLRPVGNHWIRCELNQLCSVCCLRPATALEKPTLAVWECVLLSSGSAALPEYPLCTPTGWHPFCRYSYPQNCCALQSARGGCTWSASN